MKITTFYDNQNQIEYHNNGFGKETILLNGKDVSSKWSLFGSKHIFTNDNDTYQLNTDYGLFGLIFTLKKNNTYIIKSQNSTLSKIFIIIIAVYIITFFLENVYHNIFS